MARVRILGPLERLDDALGALQDVGLLQLAALEPRPGLLPLDPAATTVERRHVAGALERVESALEELGALEPSRDDARVESVPLDRARLGGWIRLASRIRRRARTLRRRLRALAEERLGLERYRLFLDAFGPELDALRGSSDLAVVELVLPAGGEDREAELVARLRRTLGGGLEARSRRLASGELAVALLAPRSALPALDSILLEAGIEELPVPAVLREEERRLAREGPRSQREERRLAAIDARLVEIGRERSRLEASRATLARVAGPRLRQARCELHDALERIALQEAAGRTSRTFVLEGWLPAGETERVAAGLLRRLGPAVAVEEIDREQWITEEAPVVLENPRLFQPFEVLTRLMPLPRYGSIDPTPFVGVFFPMLFGVMLGDVGYGLVAAVLAAVLHGRARAGSLLRQVARVLGACAAFTVVFGFLYGELFGDLGRRWLGLRPLLFDRGEALLPFLGLAVALGLVHVLLGLGLGAAAALRREPRKAIGRGTTGAMLVLVVVSLLAAVGVLPRGFFTPAVVGLLLALPILIVAEGLTAPVEVLRSVSQVLSYARVMALGTASVMMAVAANRLVGGLGGAVVGVLFGLVFHLVNFALGLFGPTLHALRLHYVEFFGGFYSPGGVRYQPVAHWRPQPG